MSKHNFQEWLNREISDDPEVILAGKLEYLRLYLTDAMRELRTKAGLTQAQLAEKLGVQQAAVSKLESALKDHELEPVLHYLHQLGADLLVGVKQGEELYQVSDNEGMLLVDVPSKVAKSAEAAGMSLREYMRTAIRHFSLTEFLTSDDSVAVRVRERWGEKPLSELTAELEKCWNLSEEDDRLYVAKKILAGSATVSVTNRDSSDDNDDEIELLDLAEDLLEKLTEILGNAE